MILVMIILGPLGNVMLGRGMRRIGAVTTWDPGEVLHFLALLSTSPAVWLGVASLMTFFVAYMLILSWADYTYVQPVSAAAYGVVALLAHFVLGEAISPLRWAGVLIICLGVFVIGYTPQRSTEPS
ncbi:MAG: EamA family transporter [Acidobacteriaceae bacterium]|nr:EamA family transporter [Acidobacteriaceae bacterium]